MKSRTDKLLCFVLVTATSLLTGLCTGNSQTKSTSPVASALPRSMKGYELYSWQVDGRWNFALLTGTNALKSVDQITMGPDTVNGWVKLSAQSVDALKVQLDRLPQNESISWIGKQTRERFGVQAGPLELPPQGIVDTVTGYCRELGLNLHVSP